MQVLRVRTSCEVSSARLDGGEGAAVDVGAEIGRIDPIQIKCRVHLECTIFPYIIVKCPGEDSMGQRKYVSPPVWDIAAAKTMSLPIRPGSEATASALL
jgi:hypothetical protein